MLFTTSVQWHQQDENSFKRKTLFMLIDSTFLIFCRKYHSATKTGVMAKKVENIDRDKYPLSVIEHYLFFPLEM